MSKGKKQAFTLIALCVLMAAGICAYVFIPKGGQEDSDGETDDLVTVANIDKNAIASVQISGEGREDISLSKEG